MNEKKEKLLKLASWLNSTGFVDALNRTKDVDEFIELWHRFIQISRHLIAAANTWKQKFNSKKNKTLVFGSADEIVYPAEIACLIKIMDLDEEEIFLDTRDLQKALKNDQRPLSIKVVNLLNDKKIRYISAKDIFSK